MVGLAKQIQSPPKPLETHQYLDPFLVPLCGGLFSENVYIGDKSATLIMNTLWIQVPPKKIL